MGLHTRMPVRRQGVPRLRGQARPAAALTLQGPASCFGFKTQATMDFLVCLSYLAMRNSTAPVSRINPLCFPSAEDNSMVTSDDDAPRLSRANQTTIILFLRA